MNQYVDIDQLMLLQYIVDYGSVSISTVCEVFFYTRSQLTYKIDNLNSLLREVKLPPIALEGERLTVSFRYKDIEENFLKGKPFINMPITILTAQERIHMMAAYILCAPEVLSVFHFQDALEVSRSTVMNDLKRVRELAVGHGTELLYSRKDGYYFAANSKANRSLLFDCINTIGNSERFIDIFSKISEIMEVETGFRQILIIVSQLLAKVGIKWKRACINRACCMLSILPYYERSSSYSRPTDLDDLKIPEKYLEMADELYERFPVGLIEEGKKDLAILLLYTADDEQSVREASSCAMEVEEAADEIAERFRQILQIPPAMSPSLKDAVSRALYNTSLRSRCGLKLNNSIYAVFRRRMNYVFYILKMIISSFDAPIARMLTDDEIACLARDLLVAAGLEKTNYFAKIAFYAPDTETGRAEYERLKYSVPEVDIYYISTWEGLSATKDQGYEAILTPDQLQFPASQSSPQRKGFPVESDAKLREQVYALIYDRRNRTKTDMIISEIVAKLKNYCDFNDYAGFERLLRQGQVERLAVMDRCLTPPKLADVLSEDSIRFIKGSISFEEAVKSVAQPLIEKQYIMPEYVGNLMDTLKTNIRSMAHYPGILLLHTYPEELVRKFCIGIVSLKRPVKIPQCPGKAAKLIILIAAVDSKLHMCAVGELAHVLMDEKKRQKLLAARESGDIINILIAR